MIDKKDAELERLKVENEHVKGLLTFERSPSRLSADEPAANIPTIQKPSFIDNVSGWFDSV